MARWTVTSATSPILPLLESGGSSFLSIIYVFIDASITCIVAIHVEILFVYSSPAEVLVTMHGNGEKCEQGDGNN